MTDKQLRRKARRFGDLKEKRDRGTITDAERLEMEQLMKEIDPELSKYRRYRREDCHQ